MTEPRYIEGESAWLLPNPTANDLEVLVAGSALEPDPVHLARVNHALTRLPELKTMAVSLLDSFVDCSRVREGEEWFLEGVSALAPLDPESMVALHFSVEGDTYGYWTVTFRFDGNRYHAIEFSRRQY